MENQNLRPQRAENLDVSPVIDGFVVSRANDERIHYLNPTAAFILEVSDGRSTPADIAELVAEVFGLDSDPHDDVQNCLQMLCREGLVTCV